MRHVFLKNAVHRRGREELDIRTQIIETFPAPLTCSAGFSRLHANPIADVQVGHVLPDLDDGPAGLVTQHEGRLDDKVADPAGFIIVHIAAANTDIFQPDQRLVRPGLRNRPLHELDAAEFCHNGCFHHSLPAGGPFDVEEILPGPIGSR